MKQLAPDLWIADQPLRVAGVDLGARMTVVRLSGERLLLHSPVAPAAELVREVASLGRVVAIVAPNRFHHLFAKPWLDASAGARLFVAPGLDAKRPDLAPATTLGSEPETLWQGEVEHLVMQGMPLVNEVVFFHRASGTLLASDLAFHITAEQPPLTRFAFRLAGTYGRLAPTFVERLLVRDRAAFRASLERVLAWPFERVVVAHGSVLESGGRRELARGYSWILGSA